jgi:hypothetical protein
MDKTPKGFALDYGVSEQLCTLHMNKPIGLIGNLSLAVRSCYVKDILYPLDGLLDHLWVKNIPFKPTDIKVNQLRTVR